MLKREKTSISIIMSHKRAFHSNAVANIVVILACMRLQYVCMYITYKYNIGHPAF